MTYALSGLSITIGVLFGTLMPLFANYYPIKAALGKNLRDSLDLSKRTKDKFGVTIQKLEDVGMSFNQFIAAFLLVSIGFVTYYIIPLAFINGKLTWVFLILNLILILVVIGLTFMSTLIFNFVENIILWITLNTCCRRDKKFHSLILKNMSGHERRNTKTSIMFTLSISFLTFTASSFALIQDMLEKTLY
jgi:hypothetical protein